MSKRKKRPTLLILGPFAAATGGERPDLSNPGGVFAVKGNDGAAPGADRIWPDAMVSLARRETAKLSADLGVRVVTPAGNRWKMCIEAATT